MSLRFISQTMINQWDRCPAQFEKVQIEGIRIPPGIAARIGTGTHAGADVNHRAKIITGEDEPLDVVLDAARDGYLHAVVDGGVFVPHEELSSAKQQISDGLDMTVKLARLYRESLAPQIQPRYVEEEIYLAHPDLPVPFRGTIDVLTKDHWWIDIKTAERKWANGRADHEVQATLYWALVKEKTGKPPSRMTFEVLTRSKLEHQTNETTRTKEDMDLLVRKTKLIVQAIEAGIFLPAQPGSWICSPKFCGFWWSCEHVPSHRKILPR
jgi:PD-(D/E)XK nuclease superfamily